MLDQEARQVNARDLISNTPNLWNLLGDQVLSWPGEIVVFVTCHISGYTHGCFKLVDVSTSGCFKLVGSQASYR